MAPNSDKSVPTTGVLFENDEVTFDRYILTKSINPEQRKEQIVWKNVLIYIYIASASLYGGWLAITAAKWQTLLFAYLLYHLGGIGITAGVHRLWAHRGYKAKFPLRIFLMLCNTLAYQDSVIHWARDHRVHHKFSETDADPHNANRGFFYSHMGWLLCKKHRIVKEKGQSVDISDLWADPVLRFQKKYYAVLMPLICFVIPTWMSMYFWGETLRNAYHVNFFRYFVTLNATWLVNSAAHIFGNRPYDKYIRPVDNLLISYLALGEGAHNYHHTFPWDYKAAELPYFFNLSTMFVDLMAKLGLAYDLKTVPLSLVKKRALRTGDGSHALWGWGDKDQTKEEQDEAIILCKKDS